MLDIMKYDIIIIKVIVELYLWKGYRFRWIIMFYGI
jgi:hypothetical protein